MRFASRRAPQPKRAAAKIVDPVPVRVFDDGCEKLCPYFCFEPLTLTESGTIDGAGYEVWTCGRGDRTTVTLADYTKAARLRVRAERMKPSPTLAQVVRCPKGNENGSHYRKDGTCRCRLSTADELRARAFEAVLRA